MNDLNPEGWKPDVTPRSIYNPFSDDFTCSYRDDKNVKQSVVVPALDILSLPAWLAKHVGKHLVDTIINERDLGYVSLEVRAEIEKEVFL